MENLRPNDIRAKYAITLIWVIMALEIVSLGSSYLQYNLLKDAANGEIISNETITANDIREQIVASIYLIAYIISAVTFIRWFRRAYFNLHLKVNTLSLREFWAFTCWIIPIVNLYRPYNIMKELYKETKEHLIQNGFNIDRKFTTSSVNWWWTLWIVNLFVGRIIYNYSKSAETIEELSTNTIASIISNILGITLALITIKVIKDYSDVEGILYKIKEENCENEYKIEDVLINS